MDWTVLSAIASAVGALAAAVGVGVAGYQIRKSSQIAKETSGFDTLLRLKEQWDSQEMQQKKQMAARLLLLKTPDEGTYVADVLDFFETVAVFMNRRVLDAYLTWHTFYWWMVNFYAAARDYVSERQRIEGPKQWTDLEQAIPTLLKLEGRTDVPGPDELAGFLRDESGEGPITAPPGPDRG
jgi:hypothetical protein